MAQAYADVVATQIENVTPLLTGMFDQAKTLYSRFQKVMVSEQSGRNNRMPMLLRPGGRAQRIDLDNGSLGTGSGPKFDYTAMSPVDFTYNIAWSLKSKFTTDSTKKAVVDTVQITIAEALKEAQLHMDKYLQTSGTGLLAQATGYAAGPPLTYTCNNAMGVQLLRFGDPVTIWEDSTQAAFAGGTGQATVTGSTTRPRPFEHRRGPGLVPTPTTPSDVGGLPGIRPGLDLRPALQPQQQLRRLSFLGWTRSDYPEILHADRERQLLGPHAGHPQHGPRLPRRHPR